MKTKIKGVYIFLISCLFITGCENVDVTEKGKSSITADGILSGEIVSYTDYEIDSIKAFESNKSIVLGKGEVSTNGHFSINLSTPTLTKASTGFNAALKYSDLTASVGELDSIFAYKNNKIVGCLVRNNYTNNSRDSIGLTDIHFIYCDKANTLKGQDQLLYAANSGGYDMTYNFNLTLKKGWTEFSVILSDIGMHGLNHNTTYKVGNVIPLDLKWKYIKTGI